MAIGILLAFRLIRRRVPGMGLDPVLAEKLAMRMVVVGFIVAHVFDSLAYYPEKVWAAFHLAEPGIGNLSALFASPNRIPGRPITDLRSTWQPQVPYARAGLGGPGAQAGPGSVSWVWRCAAAGLPSQFPFRAGAQPGLVSRCLHRRGRWFPSHLVAGPVARPVMARRRAFIAPAPCSNGTRRRDRSSSR